MQQQHIVNLRKHASAAERFWLYTWCCINPKPDIGLVALSVPIPHRQL